MGHRNVRLLWTAASCTAILLMLAGTLSRPTYWGGLQHSLEVAPNAANASTPRVALVVASQRADDTTWLRNVFPAWQQYTYITDDPSARLTVPANKGREGMVYLTSVRAIESRSNAD